MIEPKYIGVEMTCHVCGKNIVYGGKDNEKDFDVWIQAELIDVPSDEYIKSNQVTMYSPYFAGGFYCSIQCLHSELDDIIKTLNK